MAARPPAFRQDGEIAQEGFERGKFIVHGDAQGLEHAAHGQIGLLFAQAWEGGADGIAQLARGGETFSGKGGGECGGVGFIRKICEHFGEGAAA